MTPEQKPREEGQTLEEPEEVKVMPKVETHRTSTPGRSIIRWKVEIKQEIAGSTNEIEKEVEIKTEEERKEDNPEVKI